MSRACGVQQQPRRLDRISAYENNSRTLKVLLALRVKIHNTVRAPVFAHGHSRDHATIANLRAILQRVRHMRYQCGGLRSHLAPLDAEATIDAVRPITMRGRENRYRPTGTHWNPQLCAARNQRVANAAHRMRCVRMSMRFSPRIPRRPGNRNLLLEQLVVRLDLRVSNRPVRPDTIARVDLEVRRMKAWHECSPVHRPAADSLAAVVRPQRERMLASRDSQIIPVELV